MSDPSKKHQIAKHAVDLISEDDCIILRNSRKGMWYKPNKVPLYPPFKYHSNIITDENILIDNGHRSKERTPCKSHTFDPTLCGKRSIMNKHTDQCEDPKYISSGGLKETQILISSDAMVQMIRLSIIEKSKPLLNNICSQLKIMNDKSKKSILNKLNFNEKLIVIKSMNSGINSKGKPISVSKRDTLSSRSKLQNCRLSSSLSKIDEKLSFQKKSLGSTTRETQSRNTTAKVADNIPKKKLSSNEDRQKSSILIKQIEEQQIQNRELSKMIRDLIFKNYALEQRLEGNGTDENLIKELKTKMKSLTQYHDDIIMSVYNAYYKLTKNLKKLKFDHPVSISTTNLTNFSSDLECLDQKSRSHSLDIYKSGKKSPKFPSHSTLTVNQLTKYNSTESLDHFLLKRKKNLQGELNEAKEKMKKINKAIENVPINSLIYRRHLLEKKFLRLQLSSIESMLKSMI